MKRSLEPVSIRRDRSFDSPTVKLPNQNPVSRAKGMVGSADGGAAARAWVKVNAQRRATAIRDIVIASERLRTLASC